VRRLSERRTPVISFLASLRHMNYSLDKVRSAHRVLSIRDRRPTHLLTLPFFQTPFLLSFGFRRGAQH
jgi:hypothetical protein